ncbi:lipocalin family protein [Pinibacter soli]|uniref:Lipocalin family protein n=1 Tax=Pinibacter soli TaxID=3044211 RepID=A0ABT6RD55_9BACT|nr:lipocalin family protein [Pinibacter soli]MDI3320509.1 lipocalin family protein [Pinibacter soli]
MKKPIVALALFASALTFSCKSTKTNGVSEGASKKSIYGTWTLNSITLDGIPNDKFDVKVLGGIPRQCMISSTWLFPSNGYGNYTITQSGGNCQAGAHNILWSRLTENNVNYLQFKELEEGVKDKKITTGYRLEQVSQDASSMVLRSPLDIAGKHTYLMYSFTKNQ